MYYPEKNGPQRLSNSCNTIVAVFSCSSSSQLFSRIFLENFKNISSKMISRFEIRKVTSYKSNSNLEAGRKLNVQKTFKKTSRRYFERLRHIQFISYF